MVKAFATSALVLSALFGGTLVFAAACSSSSDSTFATDPPKPDAEPDAPGSLLPETGTGDGAGEAAATSCTAKIPDMFTPTWKAPTRNATACTSAELTMYYAACLANPATTEADGTCTKFKTDHASCGACAEPDDSSGPIQWQLSRKFYTLNVAGCIAVEQDGTDASTSGCGEAYNAAVECTRQSCETCITEANSFTLFSDCQKGVSGMGICKSYETAEGAACTGYKNAGSPALQCFPIGSEAQDAFFPRVVGLICGP